MSAPIMKHYGAFAASQSFLLENGPVRFPLDIRGLLINKGIMLCAKREYAAWCRQNGQLVFGRVGDAKCFLDQSKGIYLVVFDETKGARRIRFSLAHELGHIVLGHLADTADESLLAERKRAEREADTFTGNLLAPPFAIDRLAAELGNVSAEAVAERFKLSPACARLRLSDYGRWLKMPVSETEKRLIRQNGEAVAGVV